MYSQVCRDKEDAQGSSRRHQKRKKTLSTEEVQVRIVGKEMINRFAAERLEDLQDAADVDWSAGPSEDDLIMLNLGCAPGYLKSMAQDHAEDVFDLPAKMHFLESLITTNHTKRIVLLEAFGPLTPAAVALQSKTVAEVCSENGLVYATAVSGKESVIYIVPGDLCGGSVKATRVDEMHLELDHARPAILFEEFLGFRVLAKHAKSNAGAEAVEQRMKEVREHADTIKVVQMERKGPVVSVIDANLQHRK